MWGFPPCIWNAPWFMTSCCSVTIEVSWHHFHAGMLLGPTWICVPGPWLVTHSWLKNKRCLLFLWGKSCALCQQPPAFVWLRSNLWDNSILNDIGVLSGSAHSERTLLHLLLGILLLGTVWVKPFPLGLTWLAAWWSRGYSSDLHKTGILSYGDEINRIIQW